MKRLNYCWIVAAFSMLAVACQNDAELASETKDLVIESQLQLPEDAPQFVVELHEYLKENTEDIEGRNDDLSVYEYLCFKEDLSTFKTVIELIPGLRMILSTPQLPVTVFAPTNDAFQEFLAANGFADLADVPKPLLNQVVANHVLIGRKDVEWLHDYMKTLAYANCDVRGRLNIFTEVIDPNNAIINGMVNIIRGNQFVGKGFVHVVDKVIAPSTVLDFALNDPQFSTLAQALTCPNLGVNFVEALMTEGGVFTIFAPTNEAFDALAQTLGVASVCDIPAETLTTVLAYHVKPGVSVTASMLARGKELHTLADGLKLNSELDGTQVKIVAGSSTATVVSPDRQANNGIIHGIDTVLLP